VYIFDGVDDRIEYPSSMLTLLASGFSAAAWVDLDGIADTAADTRTIFGVTGPTAVANSAMFYFEIGDYTASGNTKLCFTTFSAAEIEAQSSAQLPLTGWHHVAFSYDGANVRFYIDGTLDSSPAYTALGSVTGTLIPKIGSQFNNGTNVLMQGNLAEVAYWDRVITEQEIAELALRRRSPLVAARANLKFYTPLEADAAINGGTVEGSRNLIDGTAASTTVGTNGITTRHPAPKWTWVKVCSSPADGYLNYEGGTYAQARAGTAPTRKLSDVMGGGGEQPQMPPGYTHGPFGQYIAQTYWMFFAFDFHRVLPPNAVIGNALFVGRCNPDNTVTVTNVCELREFDFGAGAKGDSGVLTALGPLNCDNLGTYPLLGTKTSAPGSRFVANSDVIFDKTTMNIRDAIRRDRFTQVCITTDRMRNANTPADDETIHFIMSEAAGPNGGPGNITHMRVMYYLDPQPDYRQFPKTKPGLRRSLR
jgi:hypothetical protein